MLKAVLALSVVITVLAPSVDARTADRRTKQHDPSSRDGRRAASPQRDEIKWRFERSVSRWPRRASSDNLVFPTKEVEDFLHNNRDERPGDAIVFPDTAGKKPAVNTDFGYGHTNGPHTWAKKFPACGGSRQSPININLDIAKLPPAGVEDTLSFKYYDATPLQLTVENSGQSLRMIGNWSRERRPRISGFVLPGEFALAEVHFHWGPDDEEGSEHVIQGYRYPLEMHVVNYNTAYGSFDEARTQKDGLAVISYLFEIERRINPGLQKLIVTTKEVINPDSPGVSIDPFTLDKLAPPFSENYASYFGSLTTPPCSEVVTWIVNLNPQFVSSEQLERLRELRRSDGKNMLFNFRPVQSLNGRDIINVP